MTSIISQFPGAAGQEKFADSRLQVWAITGTLMFQYQILYISMRPFLSLHVSGISELAAKSYTEDQYGVVQRVSLQPCSQTQCTHTCTCMYVCIGSRNETLILISILSSDPTRDPQSSNITFSSKYLYEHLIPSCVQKCVVDDGF